ncbi:MAG TPA: hypothetical protein VGF69_12515 [Thermoanaerobaculia bacterium]|jgi:hypothetical protein
MDVIIDLGYRGNTMRLAGRCLAGDWSLSATGLLLFLLRRSGFSRARCQSIDAACHSSVGATRSTLCHRLRFAGRFGRIHVFSERNINDYATDERELDAVTYQEAECFRTCPDAGDHQLSLILSQRSGIRRHFPDTVSAEFLHRFSSRSFYGDAHNAVS